uniref:Uncharacterized protein n=1 Tax=Plectus sambesii TaxID=2011161 RepID=A0A914VXL1_9BILA
MELILASLLILCLLVVLFLWKKELHKSMAKMIFWTPVLFPWLVWLIYWTLIAQQTFWLQGLNRKDYALFLAPGQMNADTVRIQSEDDIAKIRSYPSVIKPNICTTANRGVTVVFNEMEAVNYFKLNASQFAYDMIGQTFLSEHHEFSVMYFRLPYYSTGTIKTLGIRRKNFNAIGQYSIEAVNELITSRLKDHIDEYSRKVGWYFGRGDFRAKSLDHLANANIQWMEVNFGSLGDIAEKNNMVRGPKSELIFQGFPNWFRSARTAAIGVYIGVMNILMGHINFCESISNVHRLIGRYSLCGNHEHLWGRE